jgi:GR25 family glycosyltransferase involved in LPS biosynthesis
MRYIVTAMPQRLESVKELKRQIPHLEIVWDRHKDAMETFLRACAEAGDDAVVRLEDDVVLTSNFMSKAEAVIEEHKDEVIQFFSRSKYDLTLGSRLRAGSSFMMNQCFYLPVGVSRELMEYCPEWYAINYKEHPSGYDTMMGAYFAKAKRKYWNHVPSLVEHRIMKSLIHPSRSSKRQSTTFER